jgi:hypothetical protein
MAWIMNTPQNETPERHNKVVEVSIRKHPTTDGSKFFTTGQVASRWGWHPESVRRAIRQRRIEAVIISRRVLVPIAKVERSESEGRMARD